MITPCFLTFLQKPAEKFY